jgi:biopolymer transport protein TolQ
MAFVLGPGPPTATEAPMTVALDPIELILHASGPVFVVVWLLILAAVAVWIIAVLKLLQLRRWARAERAFEDAAARARTRDDLLRLVRAHPDAPGARIVATFADRSEDAGVTAAVAKRAVVAEQQRASTLMPLLASIGSASPFVGLFGTVYGIMDAFLRIGREKSASLPVVAPAIGEALIATAIGLFAAIPAVVAYNAIARRLDDLLAVVEASSETWIGVAIGGEAPRRGTPREAVAQEAWPAPESIEAMLPPAEPPPLADFQPTRPYAKAVVASYPPASPPPRAGRSGAPPPLPGPTPGRSERPFSKG